MSEGSLPQVSDPDSNPEDAEKSKGGEEKKTPKKEPRKGNETSSQGARKNEGRGKANKTPKGKDASAKKAGRNERTASRKKPNEPATAGAAPKAEIERNRACEVLEGMSSEELGRIPVGDIGRRNVSEVSVSPWVGWLSTLSDERK